MAALQESPAVALLGPRQVGKTMLAQGELCLADHRDKLVILDEVHRAPASAKASFCCWARRRWTCCASQVNPGPGAWRIWN